MQNELPTTSDWLSLVKEKVSAIRFGTVNITVHEGRVTIVESIQKTRIVPEKNERSGLSSGASQS